MIFTFSIASNFQKNKLIMKNMKNRIFITIFSFASVTGFTAYLIALYLKHFLSDFFLGFCTGLLITLILKGILHIVHRRVKNKKPLFFQ